MALDERLLVRAGREARDLGTDVLRHLHREHADPAGGALDQDLVALADARHLEHGELRGEVGDREGRAGGEIVGRRELERLVRRDGHARGVAAEVGAGDHSVTDAEVADVLADRRDRTADLVPRDERLLGRIGVEADPHLHVGEVHAGVRDVDGDLVGAGRARRDVAQLQGGGGAVLLDHDVAVVGHARSPVTVSEMSKCKFVKKSRAEGPRPTRCGA